MSLMNCPKCGGVVNEHHRFCKSCGHPLAEPAPPASAPASAQPPPIPGVTPAPPAVPPGPAAAPVGSKKLSPALLIGAVILALIIVAAGMRLLKTSATKFSKAQTQPQAGQISSGPSSATPATAGPAMDGSPSDVSSDPTMSETGEQVFVIAGEWAAEDPNTQYTLNLRQEGAEVNGTYTLQNGTVSGTINGYLVSVTWEQSGNRRGGWAALTLSEDGQTLSGPWEYDPAIYNSGLTGSGTWTFRKTKSAPASANNTVEGKTVSRPDKPPLRPGQKTRSRQIRQPAPTPPTN